MEATPCPQHTIYRGWGQGMGGLATVSGVE